LYLEIFLKKFFFKFQVPSTDFRVHSKRLNESNRRRVNSRTDSGFTLIARKRTFAHRLVDEIPVGGAFRKKVPTVIRFQLMRSLSEKERASQTVRAAVSGLGKFFNFFSKAAAALRTESAWRRRNHRSMVTGFTQLINLKP
jgi:hypothetical protein